MDRSELARLIDHTVLGPETTPADARAVCAAADEHGMNACVPPCYLSEVRDVFPDLTIATVVGFPHGQQATETKCEEATIAWRAGADELDVVINVGRLQAGDVDAVERELAELVAAVPIPVKVIVETALLTDEQKRQAAKATVEADAAMLKTSTGFADGGATVADVELLADYRPVKASGGVGSYEEAMAMVEAGADRIGASSGVEILSGAPGR